MTTLQTIETDAINAEAWVVAEIQKGWSALLNVEQTLVVDVNGVFTWLKNNQAQIQSVFTTLLQDVLPIAGVVDPELAPLIPAATTALDASEAAIDALSQSVVSGSTPMSTISSAYQVYKNAEGAVNAVLQTNAAPPAPAAAATTAVTQAAAAPAPSATTQTTPAPNGA